MKIALIDFDDSFTYNLVSLIKELKQEIYVYNFLKINHKIIKEHEAFILSPGAETPNKKKKIMYFLEKIIKKNKPILGICLGFQILAYYFGNQFHKMKIAQHGTISQLKIIKNDFIFKELPKKIEVGRYHSWEVKFKKNNPLEVLAISINDQVSMVFKHKFNPIYAFQFHPESILTKNGKQLIENWIQSINL